MAEVYEVATFYHHFDIVRRRRRPSAAAPALTVRVCDGLSARWRVRRTCSRACRRCSAREVRVIAAPCIGRCEQAPAAVVHQRRAAGDATRCWRGAVRSRRRHRPRPSVAPRAARSSVLAAARRYRAQPASPATRPTAPTAAMRWPPRWRTSKAMSKTSSGHGDSGLRGLGGAGFPSGPQVAHRARPAGAAADGREHRRRRARHVQGPHLPRTRPAPLPRRHADRGVGGRHRRVLHLPARRIPRLPRAARAELAKLQRGPPAGACRRSSCAAAPAPTSAAKSPR